MNSSQPSETDALLKNYHPPEGSSTFTPAGFLTEVHPMTLAWHNIQVWREKPTRSQILDNINGMACPKQVVALMGARYVFVRFYFVVLVVGDR